MRSYLLGFAPLWKSLWIFKTVVAVKFFSQFVHCLHWQGFYPAHAFGSPPLTLLQKLLKAQKVAHRIWIRWRLRVLQKSKVPTVLDIALNSSHKDQWMRMFFFCYFVPNRGSWRQPRSSCVPPPTYHPQRPESHEESPSYSWYKNAYFRSFLKTDSPIGCIVTLHWLHDRAFGTLSLRENDLSSIFVRYFIHIRSGVRCEKYYGSSMFVLERPLSSACIGFH